MKSLMIVLVVVLLVMVASVPAIGQEAGMHGLVGARFELTDDNMYTANGKIFYVDVHYLFNDYFKLGTTMSTYANTYSFDFGIVPGFHPSYQLYETYITWMPSDCTFITICQWCNHPVSNGPGMDLRPTFEGLYLKMEYKF